MDATDQVIRYHDETKHDFRRFARSAGSLDWANQPNPFRRFSGARLIPLPHSPDCESATYADLFAPGGVAPQPLTVGSLAGFLEHALGLAAWKEYQGNRWALRCNPSSGNLHPTEAYVVAGRIPGLPTGPAVCHYTPGEHGLEVRTALSDELWSGLSAGWSPGSFLLGLTSVHWREAWKYGERAYRYCQHDLGHALAACAYSAAALGWIVRECPAVDEDVTLLLGLGRPGDFAGAEEETPGLLAVVGPARTVPRSPGGPPRAVIARIAEGQWEGQANRLSAKQLPWPLVDAFAATCRRTELPAPSDDTPEGDAAPPIHVPRTCRAATPARRLFRQRRSAVAMDATTGVDSQVFTDLLARTQPDTYGPTRQLLASPPEVHLALFVHRVADLVPGLYCLVRAPEDAGRLRAAMRPDFAWAKPDAVPADLPLFLLEPGDCRELAATLCCGQDIAADGAFSLGMIANFAAPLRTRGPWFYRRLFWESGVIGQTLYLEAEAAGLRGTGIGCFFDNAVHEVLGLAGHAYQSLYHFTVGGPREDPRITTQPPYPAG